MKKFIEKYSKSFRTIFILCVVFSVLLSVYAFQSTSEQNRVSSVNAMNFILYFILSFIIFAMLFYVPYILAVALLHIFKNFFDNPKNLDFYNAPKNNLADNCNIVSSTQNKEKQILDISPEQAEKTEIDTSIESTASIHVLPRPETTLNSGEIDLIKYPFENISDIRNLINYSIVDIETTGLSRISDKIIEIAIATIERGVVIDTYYTTINPEMHISESASMVNGIYDQDVMHSPKIEDVAGDISSRMFDRVIVAYNAPFDLAFISRALSISGLSGTIRYIDALPIARRAFPGEKSYKLKDMANMLQYGEDQTHRADDDVIMTQFVFEKSKQIILHNHDEKLRASKEHKEKEAAERFEKYRHSPLVNKTIAFTGEFSTDRTQLERMVGPVGAVLKEDVIRKLDYLVVGKLDNLPEWALERKTRKADRYIADGFPIVKLSEGEYLQMIGDALNILK